jgi:hypothetical protein
MPDQLRSILLFIALFAGGYFGVRWYTLGMPTSPQGLAQVARIVPLKPDPRIEPWEQRTRRDIAEDREREWRDSKTAQGDGDPERQRLREAVIEAATAFRLSPCNEELKKKYIEAALAYARAFVVLAGCPNFPICPDNDAAMESAKKVFRSPADARVRAAMSDVHEMGIRIKDYPGRLGLAIDFLSGSTGRGDEEFSCRDVKAPAPRRSEERQAAAAAPAPRRFDEPATRKDIDRETRERWRNNTLEALRRPGPSLCSGEGRRVFVAVVNNYYTQRWVSQHGYAVRTREEQAEVEQAWSTVLDQQIDGLVRDFYADGYLRPNDLSKSPLVDKVLAGVTYSNRACAGNG